MPLSNRASKFKDCVLKSCVTGNTTFFFYFASFDYKFLKNLEFAIKKSLAIENKLTATINYFIISALLFI